VLLSNHEVRFGSRLRDGMWVNAGADNQQAARETSPRWADQRGRVSNMEDTVQARV